MAALRVGIVGYDGIQGLDLIGPSDTFSIAGVADDAGRPRSAYEVHVVAANNRPFRTEAGILISPTTTFAKAPTLDTLMIPGGVGLRSPEICRPIARWILERAGEMRRIASVCTGIYGLAATGLLDGRRVTTHWHYAADVARRFPKLKVDPNPLFLKDGKFYTAGGVTASIDLALALVEEDLGPRVALSVARELVVFLKRPGGQTQFSEPLEFQFNSTDRFADLASWMVSHLRSDLSLEALAHRVCLSPRHFVRRFKDAFGGTPMRFVENLRLDEARRRLIERTQTIEAVAESVGFASDDAFRRAFQRRFSVKPSTYREHFVTRSGRPAVYNGARRRSSSSSIRLKRKESRK